MAVEPDTGWLASFQNRGALCLPDGQRIKHGRIGERDILGGFAFGEDEARPGVFGNALVFDQAGQQMASSASWLAALPLGLRRSRPR